MSGFWTGVPGLRRVFRRGVATSEDARRVVDEELALHLELRREELEASGMDREEAREAAAREFGDLDFTRDYCSEQVMMRQREATQIMRFEEMLQDFAYAVRSLRKNLSYTAVVVVTLGVGIAATTLIFSVINPYFFRELPYANADQIVQIGLHDPVNDWDGGRFSLPMLEDYRERTRAFDEIAAYYYSAVNLTGDGQAQQIVLSRFTGNMFRVLGSAPLIGRTIAVEEGGPAGADVAVLSQGFWESRYGADPSVLGTSIILDGVPHDVIGVMPADFTFPFNEVRLWVPIRTDPASEDRSFDAYLPVGRLKDGWTPERARQDLEQIHTQLASVYPDIDGKFDSVNVKELREALNFAYDILRVSFGILLAAVLLVLLMACVNVTSLTLARASTRGREVALRAALGARRDRLVRQFFTESVLLAVMGGALGVVLAFGFAQLVAPVIPEGLFRVGEVSVDLRVLAFAALVTLSTPIAFGLAPAMAATKGNLQGALRETAGGGGGGRRGSQGRRVLVALEVAMAVLLISGTGLMLRSFAASQKIELGFEADHVLTVSVTLPETSYPDRDMQTAFFLQAEEALTNLPGVSAVGAALWLPLNHATSTVQFARPGAEPPTAAQWPAAVRNRVSDTYFESMGIPLISGRVFDDSDGPEDPRVVVVGRALAERMWGGANPVGQTLLVGTPEDPTSATVVGVVGDVAHQNLTDRGGSYVYFSVTQRPARSRYFTMGVAGKPESQIQAAREALAGIDANLPTVVRPMREFVGENALPWTIGSGFLGVFGLIALLLASLGIYGVISYSVAQRKREIGIRLAMGASQREIRGVIMGEGLRLTSIGAVIGLVLAIGAGQLMTSVLFGVSGFDPVTLGVVILVFIGVAFASSLSPALKASRVSPLSILRAD